MAWRRVQVQLAEADLARHHQELRDAEAQQQILLREAARVETEFLAAPSATGSEFVALGAFRQHTAEEEIRLDQLLAASHEKIAAQAAVVTSKRRDLRLLEKLREQRFATWTAEAIKETTQLAEESFLARWKAP